MKTDKRNGLAIALVVLLTALLALLLSESQKSSKEPAAKKVSTNGLPPLFASQKNSSQTNQPSFSVRNNSSIVTNPIVATFPSGTNATNTNGDGQISASALKQIGALEKEKSKAALRLSKKLIRNLLYADKMRRGVPIADGVPVQRVDLDKDDQGRILVDIKADVTDALLQYIKTLGGNVVNDFPQYQAIRAGVANADRATLINNVTLLAKVAKEFNVPAVLTAVETESFSGYVWPQLLNVFPGQPVIERTSMNSWDSMEFRKAIEATGKKNIIMTGLWTEVCVTCPPRSAADCARRGSTIRRARTIWFRQCCREKSARLSRGRRRRARFQNGNVRGVETLSRQLALAGRAVLFAHGQASAATGVGNFHPVSRRAAPVVSARSLARLAAVATGFIHPARRRHRPRLSGKISGTENAVASGGHAFQLSREFRRAFARRLRNAFVGRDEKGRDAFYACRSSGGRVGTSDAGARSVAGHGAGRFSQLRRRNLGAGECSRIAGSRTSLAAADRIGESSENKNEP